MRKLTSNFKRKILALSFSVLFMIIPYIDSHIFNGKLLNLIWIFDAIALGIVFAFFMFIAGFAVIKALFKVAAGLSLLIFIAQSYCDVSGRTASGDNALKGVLLIGLTYLAFDFGKFLYKTGKLNLQKLEEDTKFMGWEKTVTISLVLLFAGLFIYNIGLILWPVISNLCIYK